MKKLALAIAVAVLAARPSPAAEAPQSDATQTCLECHETSHPGIVADWRNSRHARVTPAGALTVQGLGRKVSNRDVPAPLRGVAVGCAECHLLRPDAHQDTFDHNDYRIHVVVSPKDCATCHSEEAEQFSENLMAWAHGNLTANPVYGMLRRSISGPQSYAKGELIQRDSDRLTDADACLHCHGTKLELRGTVSRETELGEMSFPVIAGWPNQGTGRINLDGSRGACSACHTRHRFSIAMARKPHTCRQCHVGPDVPAYKVYAASKHGSLFSAHHQEWDFDRVPWTVGQDFSAPTCAACHISLLVNPEGEVVAGRSHDVRSRLPWRIFGLIYAHPHPASADTTRIRNRDGLALPTDFGGGYASAYLLDDAGREAARRAMQSACLACHARAWVDGHWQRFEHTLLETNAAVKTSTELMLEIWRQGLAAGPEQGGSPFDEYVEKVWSDGWLFYANSIRFASAMAGGGDYGVFAEGRYHLSRNTRELLDRLKAAGKP